MARQIIDLETQTNWDDLIGGLDNELITNAPIELFVRDVDGDDLNDGTTGSPLKTIVEARARIPDIIRHQVVIHVGPHTGAGYELPTFGPHLLRENIGIRGDGGGIGDGQTEIIASTATLAGTTQSYVVTSGLSDTEYNGYGELYSATIEILSGAAIGERRHIAYNTTDRIYPIAPFYNTVAEGDLYRVTVPAVQCILPAEGTSNARYNVLNAGDDSSWLIEDRGYKVVFADIELITDNSYFKVNNGTVAFYNVLTSNKFRMGEKNSVYMAGFETGAYNITGDGAPSPVSLFGAPNKYAWYGLGLGSRWENNDSEGSLTGENLVFNGFVVAGDIYCSGKSIMSLVGTSVHGNGVRIEWGFKLYVGCYAGIFGTGLYPICRIGSSAAARGIHAIEGGVIWLSSSVVGGVKIYSAYDVVISSGKGSEIWINNYVAGGMEFECVHGATPENYAALRVYDEGAIRVRGPVLPTPIGDTQGFRLGSETKFHDIDELTPDSHFVDAIHGTIKRD